MAELLRPPVGLAVAELLLQLTDVACEVGLAARDALLAGSQLLCEIVEPVLLDLGVGLETRLAKPQLLLYPLRYSLLRLLLLAKIPLAY